MNLPPLAPLQRTAYDTEEKWAAALQALAAAVHVHIAAYTSICNKASMRMQDRRRCNYPDAEPTLMGEFNHLRRECGPPWAELLDTAQLEQLADQVASVCAGKWSLSQRRRGVTNSKEQKQYCHEWQCVQQFAHHKCWLDAHISCAPISQTKRQLLFGSFPAAAVVAFLQLRTLSVYDIDELTSLYPGGDRFLVGTLTGEDFVYNVETEVPLVRRLTTLHSQVLLWLEQHLRVKKPSPDNFIAASRARVLRLVRLVLRPHPHVDQSGVFRAFRSNPALRPGDTMARDGRRVGPLALIALMLGGRPETWHQSRHALMNASSAAQLAAWKTGIYPDDREPATVARRAMLRLKAAEEEVARVQRAQGMATGTKRAAAAASLDEQETPRVALARNTEQEAAADSNKQRKVDA